MASRSRSYRLGSARSGAVISSYYSTPTPTQAETTALLAAMTIQPSAGRQALINDTIFALKNAGVWTRLDFIYVLAAHDGQAGRLNWINPAQVLTINGGVTFAANSGYSGNGVDGYLGTGINWSALAKFVQDDASIGVWVQNNVMGSGTLGSPTTNRISLNSITVTGFMTCKVNNVTGSTEPMSDGRGHTLATRSSASSYDCYKDGVFVDSPVFPSIAVIAEEAIFLRTTTNFTSGQILGAAHAGQSLSPAQIANLNSILSTYMAGVSA